MPRNYVYRLDEETGELVRRERTIDDDPGSNTHNPAESAGDSDTVQNNSGNDQASSDDRVNADGSRDGLDDSQADSENPENNSGIADNADTNTGGSGVCEASNSFVNMLSSGSVADTFGLGVEVQLSTVVHHSGAWIEYDYEQSTGHLVSMRRSDGTVLELKWHNRISRLLSIWVWNEETHPGSEPFRLASYNYDGKGRLLKVSTPPPGALRYYYDDEHRPFRWTDREWAFLSLPV